MLIECQQCHSAISDSAARCPKCNALPDAFLGNPNVCDECGALYRPAFSACGNCGAPAAIASRAERRLETSASSTDLTAPVEGASQAALDLKKRHIRAEASLSESMVIEGETTGSSAPARPIGPPQIATTEPTPKAPGIQEKVGGNWGRKLLITALGLGSAAAYYLYTPNELGTVTGHIFESVAYGFAPFIFTYLISWVVMSIRRKSMQGFFHRHPEVFILPMVLIAVSSGLQFARAQQGGGVAVETRAQQLQREIEALQANLPNQFADGMAMTSIVNGGSVVTFGFTLDATMYDRDAFSQGLEADFKRFACTDRSATKFLTHYAIPVVMTFGIGNQTPVTVRVAPSDCR